MNKFLLKCLSLGVIAGVSLIASCSDDDEDFDAPTINLSITEITAAPGDDVSVTVTTTTDAGFQSLVVKKLWEGVAQDDETLTTAPTTPIVYTVTEEDADHVVTLNFTVTDQKGKTAEKELVITVELTPRQLLLKYNWNLSQELWKDNSNSNEISDVYNDDVYRFNDDGTYDKSIGAKVDDFSDVWFKHCYYDLNDNTLKLLMSRTGAFLDEVTDTLRITSISETEMRADVTYYDLDQLDEKYDAVEEFTKVFVAVPKSSTFDPYGAGAADDAEGPWEGDCADVIFEND
jgi:hypothetical protein